MPQTKIKLGFAGTPHLAFEHFNELCSSERNDIKFVISQPSKPIGRGLVSEESLFAGNKVNAPVFQPNSLDDPSFVSAIKKFKIDLLVVVAYGKIIPEWMLNYPLNGCLNVHFSLLPKWRGASPMQRAIQNGDKETGVSFMKLVSQMDAGPIYKQFKKPLNGKDIFQTETMLIKESISNLNEVISNIVNGSLVPVPQDVSAVSYAGKIAKSDGVIDLSMGGESIIHQFNAFKRWPQSSINIRGELVKVLDIEFIPGADNSPGCVAKFDHKSLDVFCSNGIIKIKSLQFPGKKPIDSNDLFNAKRDIISPREMLA